MQEDAPVVPPGHNSKPVRGSGRKFDTPEGAAAKEVTDSWWDWHVLTTGYRPVQQWVAVFTICRRLFECGWSRNEMAFAMSRVRWITLQNMENEREEMRGQAIKTEKPKRSGKTWDELTEEERAAITGRAG